jgi:indole-3-glycerol phosphate synthase
VQSDEVKRRRPDGSARRFRVATPLATLPAVDRIRWLQAKQAEIAALRGQPLREVTPSRRDLSLYVSTRRSDLAVIARIQRFEPETGRDWKSIDLVAHAVACDDAEVAALAVATDEQRDGSLDLLRTVAAVTSAPVLRDDLILHPSQLYDARLHGADAALFPAAELTADELADLVSVAGSLHMASVIEVQSPSDLARALDPPRAIIGIDGDLRVTRQLAREVPQNRTVIALREPAGIEAIRSLRGHVDAVVVGPLLLDGPDVAATVAALNA